MAEPQRLSSNPEDGARIPPASSESPTQFRHTTLNAAPARPFLNTSTPAINPVPVELDSTPVSPVSRQGSWKTHVRTESSSLGKVLSSGSKKPTEGEGEVEEDEEEQLDEEELKARAKLIAERSNDPAVLVDIPGTPGPEAFKVAEAVEKTDDSPKT